jgi:hypothetical protein
MVRGKSLDTATLKIESVIFRLIHFFFGYSLNWILYWLLNIGEKPKKCWFRYFTSAGFWWLRARWFAIAIVRSNWIHKKCDNISFVLKSAMHEPSNEFYMVRTLYQEVTWSAHFTRHLHDHENEWTWLLQQFIFSQDLARGRSILTEFGLNQRVMGSNPSECTAWYLSRIP